MLPPERLQDLLAFGDVFLDLLELLGGGAISVRAQAISATSRFAPSAVATWRVSTIW
jgi:hypothetical protein